MKTTLITIPLLMILATCPTGASLAMKKELSAGPGVAFTDQYESFGAEIGLGLQKSTSENTDLGVVFTGGVFDEIHFTTSLQVRRTIRGRLRGFLGIGGMLAQTGARFGPDWDGYLFPTAGLGYDMGESALELHFSYGGDDATYYENNLLWLGWRMPLGMAIKGTKEKSTEPWNPGIGR